MSTNAWFNRLSRESFDFGRVAPCAQDDGPRTSLLPRPSSITGPARSHFFPMAWFRKEKKPRQPQRERLEIPADAWEKCEACGHTDIREKFVRNFNVCPTCDHHRRIRASDYVSLMLDEGTAEELEVELRSTDPLGFPEYPQRLKKATVNAGDGDALVAATGTLDSLPVNIGVMDFAFMGGSMGSVVGEKIARLGQ